MNREEIVREAAAAWLRMNGLASDRQTCFIMALFAQHFAALVAAAEREACAKFCETEGSIDDLPSHYADGIRKRGEMQQ